MVEPDQRLGELEELEDAARQITRIGRAPDLVRDDREQAALAHQTEHRLDEVRPVAGVEPGRAEDGVAAARALDGLLARALRTAIDAEGRRGLLLAQRAVCRAVEDIVRRDVDEVGARLGSPLGELGRG